MSKDKAAKALKKKKIQTGEIQAGRNQASKIQAGEIQMGGVQKIEADYGILEEYKTLRNEIQGYIDASNQIYMFIFTAVSAIYLLAYYNHDASFYLITFFVFGEAVVLKKLLCGHGE